MQNNNTARMERDLSFSQADFHRFARLSGDHNPIHVDPDYAAGTRFGATVSHGMLLFSAVRGLRSCASCSMASWASLASS